jgi:ABC-2 type transport system permease protein
MLGERVKIGIGSQIACKCHEAFAFIQKDSRIATTYKLQFVFQFCQVFFGVAVIYFIGQMVNLSGKASFLQEYGADYFSFALVGVAVTSYNRAGMVNVTENFRQMMTQGTLEAMCVTPIGYTWMLFCNSLWHFFFETIRVMFYFILGVVVFGFRFEHANWLGAIATLTLTIPIFLLFGIMSCSILIVVKRGDPINWILSSVAGLLAGTMFPVAVLPSWLRAIAFCLPLTHSLEAMRKTLLMGASINDISVNLLALLVCIAVLFPLTVVVNKICMEKAKLNGSFSTY